MGKMPNTGLRKHARNPSMDIGTSHITQCYAFALLDTAVNFSFVSLGFERILGLVASKLDIPITPQPMAESSGRGTERNRLSRSFHNNYYHKFS